MKPLDFENSFEPQHSNYSDLLSQTDSVSPCLQTDFICFAHLRWDFVYQRPQHLMTRFAKHRRVFYVEEPIFGDSKEAFLDLRQRDDNLTTVTPHLTKGLNEREVTESLRMLVDRMVEEQNLKQYTIWHYTPMSLPFTRHLQPDCTIYDCMDELSAFRGAPPELLALEKELFQLADHVFTGGQSLYESKQTKHTSVHAFPSSIDHAHFGQARESLPDPQDQKNIPHPRVGFFGVIDERADLNLLAETADLKPDWHFVMIGPVVKIDPNDLPQKANIHYLGMKKYHELPNYLAHWDLAMLPFALNESTRFISPTKTPEYLAAGKPVVSTGVRDVIRPYGEEGLVHIISSPEDFVRAGELAMRERLADPEWINRIDQFLSANSWDQTWQAMTEIEKKTARSLHS